jgi:hypothetical protein
LKIRISQANADYWRAFAELPAEVKGQARQAYRLWNANPTHPGLHFKKVHPELPIYSVRVGLRWRAMGILRDDVMIWFWIGSHADYDKLLKQF